MAALRLSSSCCSQGTGASVAFPQPCCPQQSQWQGPGGWETAAPCSALVSPAGPCARVRLDVWEKGNISLLQLSEKLRGALRHALCDATMEVRVLPAPLCMESTCPLATTELDELSSGGESPSELPLSRGCRPGMGPRFIFP